MLRVPRPRPTRGTGPAKKALGRSAIWPVRSPGGVLAGPVRSSGRPPWPPSGGPHPRQGSAGAHLSSAVPPSESPPGARGGEVCPNLLQRPRSRRSAGRETLIFRASSRGRSRPGGPLQQIWTNFAPDRPRSPTRPTGPAGVSPQRVSTGNDAAHHPGERGSLVLEGTSGGEDLFEPVRGERLGG